jgi:hypothetical protein
VIGGLALQGIQVAVWFFVGAYFANGTFARDVYYVLGSVGVLWLVLVYLLSLRPIEAGAWERARTPTLVFAVLSVFTVALLSGLFYALAHHELGNAAKAAARPLPPPTPVQTSSKVCPVCARANPLSTNFCQGCGFGLG